MLLQIKDNLAIETTEIIAVLPVTDSAIRIYLRSWAGRQSIFAENITVADVIHAITTGQPAEPSKADKQAALAAAAEAHRQIQTPRGNP